MRSETSDQNNNLQEALAQKQRYELSSDEVNVSSRVKKVHLVSEKSRNNS